MIHRSTPHRAATLALALASLLAACSGESSADTRRARRDSAGDASHAQTVIPRPSTPYKVEILAASASLTGRVVLDGEPPATQPLTPTVDAPYCDSAPADPSLEVRAGGLANAVVWVSDVRAGAELPVERRYAVTQDGCLLDPRVQAVIAGGTVNVRSVDPLLHQTVALWAGSHDTISVVRLNDAGQVVPDERIAKEPGLVELRCREHPWTRGWIAVFDHPYFAVTDANGRFRIDQLPPGRHTLMVWHERGVQPVTQQVEVPSSGEGTVEVKLAVR